MHLNKPGSSDNSMSLLTSSSSASSAPSPALNLAASGSYSPSSSMASSSKAKTKSAINALNLGVWWLLLMVVILMAQQQPCECRYLPTRSHGDDLDKLRELMLQILESSNEDVGAQQRPPNEANGNALAVSGATAQRANWLNKLGGSVDIMDVPRKYNAPRGIYDNGRYY